MFRLQNVFNINEVMHLPSIFFAVTFFAFITGTCLWYEYHCFYLFLVLPFVPIFFLFFKDYGFPFLITVALFFILFGVLRASFVNSEYEGVIYGKGKIISFIERTQHYKKAQMRLSESTNKEIKHVEARFDISSDVNFYDEIVFMGEYRRPAFYKNISNGASFVEHKKNEERYVKIKSFKILNKNKFFESIMSFREKLLENYKQFKGTGSEFFVEVLFGERLIADKDRDTFVKTGTAHLLSISGLHFVLMIFFGYFIVLVIQFFIPAVLDVIPRPLLITIVSLPLLIFYAYLSGLSIPATRAFLLFLLSSVFLILRKSTSTLNLLFLIALVFVIDNPVIIFKPSFQLSFISVFALIMCYKRFKAYNFSHITGYKKILWYFFTLLLSTFIINLFTFPLLQTFSKQNIVASFLANPFVIPVFSFLLLPFLFIALPFSLINVEVFNFIMLIPQWAWHFIIKYLSFIKNITDHFFIDLPFNLKSALTYYALISVLIFLKKRIKFILLPIGVIILAITMPKVESGPMLVFPDLGQGDGAIIKTTKGKIILVDAGGNVWDDSLFKRAYLPVFRRLGIKKIDMAIFSHDHPDHTKAITNICEDYKISDIYTSSDNLSMFYNCYKSSVTRIKEKTQIQIDDMSILLMPSMKSFKGNNSSMWALINYNNIRTLFTGDAEKRAIFYMLNKYKRELENNIFILKVPHHGALSSFDEILYNRLMPKFAVITLGLRNLWQFPSRELIMYLSKKKIKVFRTDLDGEIDFYLSEKPFIKTYKMEKNLL